MIAKNSGSYITAVFILFGSRSLRFRFSVQLEFQFIQAYCIRCLSQNQGGFITGIGLISMLIQFPVQLLWFAALL
jgi:hypothetical protein